MVEINLEANVRKIKQGRAAYPKDIPAVFYGRGVKSKSLWIKRKDFMKAWEEAGESTVLNLAINGEGKNEEQEEALIYDMQFAPMTGEVTHVDFYRVVKGQKLDADVELVIVGETPLVKESGGTLVKAVDSLEIRCLPKDLPSEIKVDISVLKTFDDHIYVKDLPVSDGVEILSPDPETVVALVSAPRSQEDLEKLNEEIEGDASAVESVKGGDKAEDEEISAEPEEKKKPSAE